MFLEQEYLRIRNNHEMSSSSSVFCIRRDHNILEYEKQKLQTFDTLGNLLFGIHRQEACGKIVFCMSQIDVNKGASWVFRNDSEGIMLGFWTGPSVRETGIWQAFLENSIPGSISCLTLGKQAELQSRVWQSACSYAL